MDFHPSTHIMFWWIGGLSAGAVALGLTRRDRLPLGRSALAIVVVLFLATIGSRLYYLIDNDVPLSAWAREGPFSGGVRIPGGLLLVLFVMPLVLRALRLPGLRFADAAIPATGLGLAIGRINCLVVGCCFGKPTDLPWAIQFGRHSPAWVNHAYRGLVSPDSQLSLAVHPLQVYFGLAALGLGLGLLWFRRHRAYEGEVFLVFIAVYSWMKLYLESFRERILVPDAPDPFWIELAFGLAATVLLIGLRLKRALASRAIGAPPAGEESARGHG
jgi:phosphatidylglycerol:prolipoprotein diacylglycerol transferase